MSNSNLNNTNLFRPPPHTHFQCFLSSPTLFLAKWLYTHCSPLLAPSPGSPPIRIVCISDTHNQTPQLPAGDILIHAGDMCINGTSSELSAQLSWLNSLDFKHKIVIAGNHDVCLASTFPPSFPNTDAINWGTITYLQNSCTTTTILLIHGRRLKIYGSPFTPQYGNWAFQYLPHLAHSTWADTVPSDTDILVSHGPARGHLDSSDNWPNQGCKELLREVRRVRPRLHVCGHVHGGRGREVVDWDEGVVQGGYDKIMAGDGGWWVLVGMVIWWCWEWVSWGLGGGKRTGEAEVVNAAMREDGERRGEDGVVVRI